MMLISVSSSSSSLENSHICSQGNVLHDINIILSLNMIIIANYQAVLLESKKHMIYRLDSGLLSLELLALIVNGDRKNWAKLNERFMM